MKSRKQDFALGLTAIVMFALLMATILFLYPSLRYAARSVEIRFRHDEGVAPLKPGSPVMLSGAVQVGTVRDVRPAEVELDTPQGQQRHLMIVVRADVDRSIQLFEGCQITTDQPPVGGSGMVVILNVGTPGQPLGPEAHIQGLPPQSLAAVVGGISRRLLAPGGVIDRLDRMLDPDVEGSLLYKVMASLDDVNTMTREVRTQLSPQERQTLLTKLHRVMDDINAMTGALRAQVMADDGASLLAKTHVVLDHLSSGLSEAAALVRESRPPVQSTLARLEHTAKTVDEELIAALRKELDREDSGSLLGKLHVAMDGVNASLADVQTVSAAGRRMLVLNRSAIERTLANVKEMSEQLRLASQEIRLAPWRLLYRPKPEEKQELGVFEAARTFAEAATYLDDAAARLEAVVAAAPSGGATLEADEEVRAIRISLQAAFERFQRAEEFLWEKMK